MDPVVFYRIFLPLIFVLLILPLLISFIFGQILFRRIDRKHIKILLKDFTDDNRAQDVFDEFRRFIKEKIRTPFPSRYNIKGDLKTLLLLGRNAYDPNKKDELEYSFSVSDLIKSFFLLMNDLNEMWKGNKRIERLARTRMVTFLRINKISGYYNIIYRKIPFLKILRKGRITGKIIRIILIPLIGLPSIFISIFVSLFSLFLTEFIWRHYYSVLLIRCFYYILVLYGDKKTVINRKLKQFTPRQIKDQARMAEKLINPENDLYRSAQFEEAFLCYQQMLDKFNIGPEKDKDFNGISYRFSGKRKFFKRVFQIPLKAAGRFNPIASDIESEREYEKIFEMIRRIATTYDDKSIFYSRLRIIDLFDSLYMASLLAYNPILRGSFLLDNISVEFLLTAKNLSDEITGKWLKKLFPHIRQTYRSYKLYRKGRFIWKAVRNGNPTSLVLSISGPLAAEGVRTVLRDFIYRRAGRLALYCFECNQLKKKRLFDIKIIEKNEILSH